MNLTTLLLSGSGGNGKTTLAKELVLCAEERRISAHMMPSTTRATFERLGLTTEQAGLERRADAVIEIQQAVLKDFLKGQADAAQHCLAHNIDWLICDRSPLDYTSYLLQVVPTVAPEVMKHRDDLALRQLKSLKECGGLIVWSLPTTPPWEVQDDGYRHMPSGKNLAWNALAYYQTVLAQEQLLFSHRRKENDFLAKMTSVFRAQAIAQSVFGKTGKAPI